MKRLLLVLVAVLTWAAPQSLAWAEPCTHGDFEAARVLASRPNPFGVAAGDLNGDGHADAVSVSLTDAFVTVALGSGDTTFQAGVDYAVGVSNPDTVVLRDLNEDDKPDIVASSSAFGSSAVLVGNGNGTFQQPAVDLTGVGGPYALAFDDLDGDQIDDVVTAGGTVQLGHGDLTFADPLFNVVPGGGVSVVIADVAENGGSGGADGILDVVIGTAGATGDIVTLVGNGAGTFQPAVSTLAGANNDGLAVGDFDGDGKGDVAVLNTTNGAISSFLGNGDGTFHIREFHPTGNIGPIVSAIRTVDLNHDEKLDLIVGDFQTFVLLGNGDGTFQAPVRYYQLATDVALADFNGDGEIDVLTGKAGLEGQPNVALLVGNGDGTLQEAPGHATGHGPLSPRLGDLNGDQKLDLVVPNAFASSISIFLNLGDGTFGPKVDYTAGATPISVAIGRFNADSNADLIVANQNSPDILFYAGNGDGTFQAPAVAGTTLIGAFYVVAGKFDGDANLDFAASAASLAGAGVMVFSGNGNGTFKAPGNPAGDAFLLDTLASGDFNRDGKLDVVYSKTGAANVGVLLGNGAGGFANKVDYTVGTNPQSVAVADFNGDGTLDVVTANFGCNPCSDPDLNFQGSVSVLLGNGDGAFLPHQTRVVNVKGTMAGVAAADLSGDGNVDVAVTDLLLGNVSVLLGNGDGTFQSRFDFAVQNSPNQPAAGDLDGNGSIDLVVANQAVDTVSVLLNACSGAANPGCSVDTECDDEDPCTQNLCDTGFCAFPKVADFIPCAVANRLNPAACEGAKVPGGFRKKFAKAAHAQEALLSGTLPEKKLVRARNKADAALAKALRAVDKAEGKKKQPMPAACAAALRALVAEAADSLAALGTS